MQLINSEFLKYFHTFYHISLTSSTAIVIRFIVICLFIVYFSCRAENEWFHSVLHSQTFHSDSFFRNSSAARAWYLRDGHRRSRIYWCLYLPAFSAPRRMRLPETQRRNASTAYTRCPSGTALQPLTPTKRSRSTPLYILYSRHWATYPISTCCL